MKDKDTPLRLVRLWEKMNPGVYAELDRCRAAKDEGQMSWPDYCELPIGAAFTYLVDIADMSHVEAAMVAAELTACWTWRRCKKIFSFDDDLAAALAAQAEDVQDTDVLPADLLLHLPYPCVYIKAPVLLDRIDGFFVWDGMISTPARLNLEYSGLPKIWTPHSVKFFICCLGIH